MHPVTKKNYKNMPYLTLTEKSKVTTEPGNNMALFWDTHTFIHLLTYLPRNHMGTAIITIIFTIIHLSQDKYAQNLYLSLIHI